MALNLCFYIKEKDVLETLDDCIPRAFLAEVCNYFLLNFLVQPMALESQGNSSTQILMRVKPAQLLSLARVSKVLPVSKVHINY